MKNVLLSTTFLERLLGYSKPWKSYINKKWFSNLQIKEFYDKWDELGNIPIALRGFWVNQCKLPIYSRNPTTYYTPIMDRDYTYSALGRAICTLILHSSPRKREYDVYAR